MNPQAIIAALPWLRRIWRVLPPPLRVPLLLVVAVIGIIQFVQGRKQDEATGQIVGGPIEDPRSPSGSPG